MKTPSTELHQIIHSLTAQEKKYFKQYSAQYADGKETGYILLFDAIAEQAEYDEEALKRKFAKEDFVKQLSVAKNYLTEKILDALVNMYADSMENLQMERMIGRYEILLRKKLIDPAITFYEKAEKRAIENGNLTFLPHITRQKNILLFRSNKNYSQQEALKNSADMIRHAEVLLNFLQYEDLQLRFNLIITNPKFQTDEKLQRELDEIASHPLFEDAGRALSEKAWNYYSKVKLRYLHIKGRHNEAYAFSKSAVKYLQKNTKDSLEWHHNYYYQLLDLFQICSDTQRFDECKELLTELQKIASSKSPLQQNAAESFFNFNLKLAVDAGTTQQGIDFWIAEQTYWSKFSERMEISVRNCSLFYLLRLYFRAKMWKEAIEIYHEYIAQKTFNAFIPQVRIYWLMIQYEIRNVELLPNQVRNIKAWFKKENMQSELEKLVLRFFEKIPNARDKNETAQAFKKLETQLHKYSSESLLLETDLLDWAKTFHLKS